MRKWQPQSAGVLVRYHCRAMRRRSFLGTSLAAFQESPAAVPQQVYADVDGVPLTTGEYSQLLEKLTKSGTLLADSYSRGGIVEALEGRIASLLGKEAAVWLPTGTLANHLAVRLLAGPKRRVIVQAESHLYRDSGDCAQTLSGLHLIPVAQGKATFALQDVERAANDALTGRVDTAVGAIQIESPVRRLQGERFDFEQMKAISAWARARGVGLHLDGARIFLESAYTRRPLREYAALFDTVYVSMYKYFNAASGAVLAGPASLLANLYHTRRMFGGGLNQVWPFAAVALHFQDGFEQRFREAADVSERVIAILSKDGNFGIERVANGTNLCRMRVFGVNAPVYRDRLEGAGITAREAQGEWFLLHVNETWRRFSADELVGRFRKALG